jgi:hypothetical protein
MIPRLRAHGATCRLPRRLVLPVLALAALGSGCGTKGSGTAARATRTVPPFTEVETQGIVRLELTLQKPACTVELSGDDNLVPLVETDVVGSRLVIRTQGSIRPTLPLVAIVGAPDATAVSHSGAGELSVREVKNEKLRVALSGAASAVLDGATGELALALSGAGSIDAQKLSATNVHVDVSGAGSVAVGPTAALAVTVSGAGAVSYEGNPSITQSISGAGVLRKR